MADDVTIERTKDPDIRRRIGTRETTYIVTLSVGTYADGRRRQLRKSHKTYQEAKNWKTLTLHQLRSRTYLEPSPEPFGAFLWRWIDALRGTGIRPNSLRTYRQSVGRLHPLHAVPLSGLTSKQFAVLWTQMTDAGYAAASVALTARHARAALDQAVKERLVDHNPVRDARAPSVKPHGSGNPLSLVETRALLAQTAGSRWWPLFRMAIDSGARIGELRALRWDDVDWDAGLIRIRRTVTRQEDGPETEGSPKGHRARTVSISAEAITALRIQRDWVDEERAKRGDEWNRAGYVFPGPRTGGRSCHVTIRKALRAGLSAAGIEPRRIHDLRHTNGTLLADAKVDAATIGDRLGHADPSIALRIYIRTSERRHKAAAETVTGLLTGPGDQTVTTRRVNPRKKAVTKRESEKAKLHK